MNAIKAKDIMCEIDRETSDEKIKGRAESIKGIGLIHSVKIQKIEDEKYQYRVVAGRCSFLALTQILEKEELKVPEEVSFIEGDPEIIAFAENDERTDLTLAEQVEKLDSLSEKFGIAELALRLSHSPGWIAARIRLKELSSSWKKAMKEKLFPRFSIGHYETIAKYPPEAQEDIFESCSAYNFDDAISAREFAKSIEAEQTHLLKNAPWNTDKSYQGCGECPACIDRKNNGFLFDEMNDYDKARCQNKTYYETRLAEFILAKVEEIRKEKSDTPLLSQSYCLPEDFPLAKEEVYLANSWTKSTKKDDGKKAFVVFGPMAGSFIYANIFQPENKKEDGTPEPKKVKTLEERKELKNRQRQRHAIDTLMEYLQEYGYEIPERNVIFALIASLGVDAIFHYDWKIEKYSYGAESNGIAAFETASALEELDKAVWKKLVDKILKELKIGQSGPVPVKWNEAEIISRLTGFDLAEALEKSIEELPDPKCWKKLEELAKAS